MTSKGQSMNSGNTKVLVIYFSHSGNTRKVAQAIHEFVGGDISEIRPLEPYPNNYNAVVEQAKRELHSGYQPEIETGAVDVALYATIFVGSPNWWHTIAPPVISFLSQSDLSGKTIIPFVTHGGGGLGRSAVDIATLCPGSDVLESLSVYGADVSSAQSWLSIHWPIKH